MTEYRPYLALLGLLVVAGVIVFLLVRALGWRLGWWDRVSSSRRRRRSRARGESGTARSSSDRPAGRGSSPGRRGPESGRAARPGGSGDRGESREPLAVDGLPLLDPLEGRGSAVIDQEFDVGDLGAIDGELDEEARGSGVRGEPPGPRAGSGVVRGTDPATASRPSAGRASAPRRPSRDDAPAPAEDPTELLVVLTILTSDEHDLRGAQILESLTRLGLEPDERDGLFHHFGNRHGPTREPVFSAANVLNPGVFDFSAMDGLTTPGLCLFMRRPGPLPANVSFDLMLDVATRLARRLEAVVCDQQRCRLTVQATHALRERVMHFALRHERGSKNAR